MPSGARRVPKPSLLPPEDLLRAGLKKSRVVMVNEAHHGDLRCIRTRAVGERLLPVAHDLGVRHLAMEALWDRAFADRANRDRVLPPARSGYLAQPEMRSMIQVALDLGWTLLAYEADMSAAPSDDLMAREVTAWRELQQAENLLDVLPDGPTLIWCGWGHLSKPCAPSLDGFKPMAQHFQELSGIEPFALDQTTTIHAGRKDTGHWLELFADDLSRLGGTAGFFVENAPQAWRQKWADAYLLSLENELE
jgi:hypothetical protein